MKKVIKNNYKLFIGIIIGVVISVTSVYAVEAYIESNKVSYDNHEGKITKKDNVQDSIDELYERSGIHKEKWVDPILNGADPVLKEPLIPVEIKPNGDVYYANENSEWYNYSEKRWANSVILIDNPGNTNYQVGDYILEDDIESYFVWIPRYSYNIWDMGNYTMPMPSTSLTNDKATASSDTSLWRITGNNTRIIDIKFGNVEKTLKMNESEAKLNEYYTHPAFTLGEKELNGIWIGKFETGYKGATSTENAQVDSEDSSSVIIKPDAYSWREITAKNAFFASYNYKNYNNKHNENIDPHMLKNTEWGAAVYLSHSEYGIGTEININNATDYKTGYSTASNISQCTTPSESSESTDKTTTQPWNTPIGNFASTTGNITGIYDMSGGSWEYVAACMEKTPLNSGFDEQMLANEMAKGYIDKYSVDSSMTSYNKRILGDATGELGPFYNYYEGNGIAYNHSSWYTDYSYFVAPNNPWFVRGSYWKDGALAGQYYFSWGTGAAYPSGGFRIALAVTV